MGDGVEQERPKLAIEMKLEELEAIFASLTSAVEEMMKPDETTGKPRELTTEDGATLAGIAEPLLSAPERIDQFVALIRNYEFREALLRGAVKSAESKARGVAALGKALKDAAEQYMVDRGVKKIMGFANELALYKKADKLEIHNEELIPDGYFDTRLTFRLPPNHFVGGDLEELKVQLAEEFGLIFESANRTVNTERVIKTLETTETVEVEENGIKVKKNKFREVHGAEIIRDGRRLNIK